MPQQEDKSIICQKHYALIAPAKLLSQCDGSRPQCRRCADRGVERCTYDVEAGKTRYTNLKSINESLVKQVGAMEDFVKSLHSKPSSEASSLLNRLRSSSDALDFVKMSHDGQINYSPSGGESSTFAQTSPSTMESSHSDYTSQNPKEPQNRPKWYQSQPLPHVDPQPAYTFMDTGNNVPNHIPFGVSNALSLTSTLGGVQSSRTKLSSGIEIHDELFLRRAVSTYLLKSGKIFHVFTQNQLDSQFTVLYRPGNEDTKRVAAGQICSAAAIGSQYMSNLLGPIVERQIHDTASSLVGDVIAADPLIAAKSCSLLGMFNIMHKEKVALTYIGVCELSYRSISIADLCKKRWA